RLEVVAAGGGGEAQADGLPCEGREIEGDALRLHRERVARLRLEDVGEHVRGRGRVVRRRRLDDVHTIALRAGEAGRTARRIGEGGVATVVEEGERERVVL